MLVSERSSELTAIIRFFILQQQPYSSTIQTLRRSLSGQQSHSSGVVEYAEKQGDECVFPTERWAATFRSLAHLILMEIAAGYRYPPPNLGKLLYREAKQLAPSRLILLEEVNGGLCGGSPA
jgi:hypothetical protein